LTQDLMQLITLLAGDSTMIALSSDSQPARDEVDKLTIIIVGSGPKVQTNLGRDEEDSWGPN
jgi:hypothetical protein